MLLQTELHCMLTSPLPRSSPMQCPTRPAALQYSPPSTPPRHSPSSFFKCWPQVRVAGCSLCVRRLLLCLAHGVHGHALGPVRQCAAVLQRAARLTARLPALPSPQLQAMCCAAWAFPSRSACCPPLPACCWLSLLPGLRPSPWPQRKCAASCWPIRWRGRPERACTLCCPGKKSVSERWSGRVAGGRHV